MFIDLLNIENNVVIPGIECYTIPELKTILNNYSREEALEIFTYLHFMYHPKSSYKNESEDEMEEIILEDIRTLGWSVDEVDIVQAKKMIKKRFVSPTRRFFLDAKAGLEKLGQYMRTAPITDGKDGNFAALSVNFTRIGRTMEDFKKLEKLVEEEEGPDIRGGQEISEI